MKSYAPMVDWLTLASYKFKAYTDMAAWCRKTFQDGKWKGARWLQYDGFQSGVVFFGKALQTNNKEHYIMKVSGALAHEVLERFRLEPFADNFYCTRLDIQRTIPRPIWWQPRQVVDDLILFGSLTSLIESTTGSTVYVGSRNSGRFTRMYEKKISNVLFVRLEIELKNTHSRLAYEYLLDGANVKSLYASHLAKLPILGTWKNSYMPQDTDSLDLTLALHNSDNESRLKWLKTLIPTFNKMVNDHTIGEETYMIFHSLLQSFEENNGHDNFS